MSEDINVCRLKLRKHGVFYFKGPSLCQLKMTQTRADCQQNLFNTVLWQSYLNKRAV
jgi:hypothetical protein